MTDELRALHSSVDCYLSTLLAIANCVGEACPAIGGLYRHRLTRLRSRLAFDSSPAAMEESARAIEVELSEYSAKTFAYLEQHGTGLKSSLDAMQDGVKWLGQRQDYYGARLRQFAARMEAITGDNTQVEGALVSLVAGLLSCIESMSHETHSMVARMNDELEEAGRRLHELEVTDPLTGLMNRREMERRIESFKAAGQAPVLLHIQLSGEITDEVAKQAAERVASQFRPQDFVSRWSDTEFVVLFQGPFYIAQMRVEQIAPWVAGRYLLDCGETVQVEVEVGLTQLEPVA